MDNMTEKTFDIDVWHGIGAILSAVVFSIVLSNASNHIMDGIMISFLAAWFISSISFSLKQVDFEAFSEAHLLRGASFLSIAGALSSIGFVLAAFANPAHWKDLPNIIDYRFYFVSLTSLALFGFSLYDCNRVIKSGKEPYIPLVFHASSMFLLLVVILSFNVYNMINVIFIFSGVFLGGFFAAFIERSFTLPGIIAMVFAMGLAPNAALSMSKSLTMAVFLFYFAFFAGVSIRRQTLLILSLAAFSFAAFHSVMRYFGLLDTHHLALMGNLMSGLGWCILCAVLTYCCRPFIRIISSFREKGHIIRFLSWAGGNYPVVIGVSVVLFGLVAGLWIDSILIKAGDIGIDGWLLFVFMNWHKVIFWEGWNTITMIQIAVFAFSVVIVSGVQSILKRARVANET